MFQEKERWFDTNNAQWQHTNGSSTSKKIGSKYLPNQAQKSGIVEINEQYIIQSSARFFFEGTSSKQYVDFICLHHIQYTLKYIKINIPLKIQCNQFYLKQLFCTNIPMISNF